MPHITELDATPELSCLKQLLHKVYKDQGDRELKPGSLGIKGYNWL